MKNKKYKLFTCEKTKSLVVGYGNYNYLDDLKNLHFEHLIINPLGEVDFGIVEDTVIICMYGDGVCFVNSHSHSLKRDDFYLIDKNSLLKINNTNAHGYICLLKISSKGVSDEANRNGKQKRE